MKPPLDLSFLATGVWQHVFTKTGEKDGPWVYKIPAAFGYILPFTHFPRFFWPRNAYEDLLYLVAVRIPWGFRRRFKAGRLITLGQRLMAAHCRRTRLRNFVRMLELIESLSQHGLDDLLLPCRILPERKALLRVRGEVFSYEGPMLVQRKVAFVDEGLSLDSFDWSEPVGAQHRLWRRGAGSHSSHQILGALKWELFEGHLCLADTSALTEDYRLLRRRLSNQNLDVAERQTLQKLRQHGCADRAEAYFRFVRSHIDQAHLARLWRQDVATAHNFPRPTSGRGAGGEGGLSSTVDKTPKPMGTGSFCGVFGPKCACPLDRSRFWIGSD